MEYEFKGTKGEWNAINQHSFETKINCGDIRIAQAKHYNTGEDDGFMNDPKPEEGQANAKLIAAAPDLLRELINMVQCLDTQSLRDRDVHSAKIAIEKATI